MKSDLINFSNQYGIKVERRDYKHSYLERISFKFRYMLAENLPDLGKLFWLKNRLFGISYYGKDTSIRGGLHVTILKMFF